MTTNVWMVGLLVLSAFAVPTWAGATTISFEATGQSGACGVNVTSTVSDGFMFSSDHHHICDSTRTDLVSNGTNYLLTELNVSITMSRVGGGAFSVTAFDLSEAFTSGFFAPFLEVTGILSGGGTITAPRIALDGLRDGPGGIADFQHVLLSGFSNVTSVTFTGFSAAIGGGITHNFSLDNIVVGAAAVPDAGSAAMMLLGAMGVMGASRRLLKRQI